MTTIQVIDDDVVLLARMATLLEEAGYTVLTASELSHAEVQFNEERPDMVILEVKSGRDAGWHYLERIVGQAPVLVVSAHSREEDVVRGLTVGAIDYVAKPYRSHELLTRICLRLNMARSLQSLSVPMADSAVQPDSEEVVPDQPDNDTSLPGDLPVPTLPAQMASTDAVVEPLETPVLDQAQSSGAVFMAENEELALIRSSEHAPTSTAESAPAHLPLGQRLNRERLRRRMTLVQAESELHIRMWYLQAMEEEKFTLLPGGPAAIQMLRSYAAHLGLDADVAVAEYMDSHYTPPVVPPPSLGSSRSPSWSIARWKIWAVAIVLALLVSMAGIVVFDPSGAQVLTDNLRGVISAPTATFTPTATPAPSATPTATPNPTDTPQPSATATPAPPPPPPVEPSPVDPNLPAEPGTGEDVT